VSKTVSRGLWLAAAFLLLIAPGGAQSQLPKVISRQSPSPPSSERFLRLYNTHTGERIELVFRRGQQYLPGALAKLDYFLRDHTTGDVRHFDPRLYDILSDLTASVGEPGAEIDIVCGYRTPSTNESLRAQPPESPRTVSTFRQKPLTSVCPVSTH
jgi:uncharacterized protein YcbK (DUF882 family)